MTDGTLSILAPSLLVVGLMLCLAWLPRDNDPRARVAAALLGAVLTLRYISWRVDALPPPQSWLQDAWVLLFLGTEMLSALSSLLVLFFMSRHIDRSAQADAEQGSPLLTAPVDVFIATYNEAPAILERTIVGAMGIDHPDLRVWVLDDGARAWVQEMAEDLGALYLHRIKGKHAKAGNVNNGLAHALRTGRPPEFILLLDADFVANRQILRRVLGLFREPDVGIVQTPQHFFNPDPVQINLVCTSVWPDEQRFFFNVLLACKDAWGAAFCCGTSAVLRVEALKASGGMATETVTEDMLTSFKMREHGWRTIFLNERLSLGLAPEGLSEYITQRGRWCLGAIQQLWTRWSCFGAAPIGFINRLSYFDGALFWIVTFPFRLMMMSAPAVYWWTGTSVVSATVDEIVIWLMPAVLGSTLFMTFWGRKLILPVMTDVTQMLASQVVIANVVAGLFRPWGRPFKVTPKGISRDRVTVQWGVMAPFLFLAAATASGLALNATAESPLLAGEGYAVNVFWSIFAIAVFALAGLACVELPRRRSDERFTSNEQAVVVWPGRSGAVCRIRDISMGGARLWARRWVKPDETGELMLDSGRLRVPFRRLRQSGDELVVRFEVSTALRRALIERLFVNDYVAEVESVDAFRVLRQLFGRLLQ
ncbi:MAG: glycosyltransferase [Acetobacteraceae bacterium]